MIRATMVRSVRGISRANSRRDERWSYPSDFEGYSRAQGGSNRIALFSLLLVGLCGAADAQTRAARTSDFVDSVGVNTRVSYTDGKYSQIDAYVISNLKYLGIRHVRDAMLNPNKYGQASYARLAEAGMKLNLGGPGRQSIAEAIIHHSGFALKYPGAINFIEGPNEVGINPVTYEGQTGPEAAVALQNDLYAAVKGSSVLKSIPVFHMTAPPGVVGSADFANMHPYPRNGEQPLGRLTYTLQRFSAQQPGLKRVFTESGYYTLPGGPGWEGVDELTQAKLTLNLIFDAFKLGIAKVYLYQLLDAYPDPTGTMMNRHFGLFKLDNQPKRAATAIHNLTTILRDMGQTAGTFTPGSLTYSVTGLTPSGGNLLFQKSSGAFLVVIWDEPDIWNETTNRAITVLARAVRLDLGSVFSTVRIFDPLVGTNPVATKSNARTVQVSVKDHPLVIELTR